MFYFSERKTVIAPQSLVDPNQTRMQTIKTAPSKHNENLVRHLHLFTLHTIHVVISLAHKHKHEHEREMVDIDIIISYPTSASGLIVLLQKKTPKYRKLN